MDHTETAAKMYTLINAHNLDGFAALMADDFVEHEPTPGIAPTKDGVRQFFEMYIAAFPDMQMEPLEVLPSGDKVVVRLTCTGTHEGEFMGMPPTGKRVEVDAIDILRFGDDGLAHEHWGVFDAMAMMQQLGAIPEAAPAP